MYGTAGLAAVGLFPVRRPHEEEDHYAFVYMCVCVYAICKAKDRKLRQARFGPSGLRRALRWHRKIFPHALFPMFVCFLGRMCVCVCVCVLC